MRLNRLRVENFKCYASEDVEFPSGVTAIHGPNGAGKSSLLEAAYFALYGSDSLPGGESMSAVITNDTDEMEVELWFTYAGEEYRVQRELRDRSSGTSHNAELTGPDVAVDGPSNVDDEIVKMLRMDADAYTNCSYVRQDEVKKLIKASPSDRQEMIDELLQLGVLTEYADRANRLQNGVRKKREELSSKADELASQIDDLDEDALRAELADVTARIDRIDDLIDEADARIADAEATKEDAQSRLDELADLEAELEDLQDEADSLREDLQEETETIEEANEDITTAVDLLTSATDTADTALGQVDRVAADSVADLEGVPESFPDVDHLPVDDGVGDVDLPDVDAGVFEVDRLRDLRSEVREERNAARDRKHDLENDLRSAERDIESAEQTAEQAADRISSLEADIEEYEDEKQEVCQKRGKLLQEQTDEVEPEIERLEDKFAESDVTPETAAEVATERMREWESEKEELKELEQDVAALEAKLEDAQDLIDEGKCPECGRPIEDEDDVASVDGVREELAEKREEVEEQRAVVREAQEAMDEAARLSNDADELARLREKAADLQDRIDERDDRLAELDKKIEAAKADIETAEEEREDALATVEERQDAVESIREDLEEIDLSPYEETIDHLTDAIDALDKVKQFVRDIETAVSKKESAVVRRDRWQDELAEVEAEIEEKQTAFDDADPDALRETKADAQTRIDAYTEWVDALSDRRSALDERKGSVQGDLSRLDELRERKAEFGDRTEKVDQVHEDLEQVKTEYEALREDLRRQNLALLEQVVNEIFDELYQADTYSRIEITKDCELMVYEKDETEIPPRHLSGGEKVVFNLSLRCGIYKLLAEGIEGDAPMPPLILDEPTANLDEDHVGRIARAVDLMQDLGIDQTMVVSHDREVVDSADETIEVEQDDTTNRSSATLEQNALSIP